MPESLFGVSFNICSYGALEKAQSYILSLMEKDLTTNKFSCAVY